MSKKLRVYLPPNWVDYSKENPNGPPTYLRTGEENFGVLQIDLHPGSQAEENRKAKEENLMALACDHGTRNKLGKLAKSMSGKCQMGIFGSAVFHAVDKTRIQIWYLSNQHELVFATHLSGQGVSPLEMDEAHRIVMKVDYCEETSPAG